MCSVVFGFNFRRTIFGIDEDARFPHPVPVLLTFYTRINCIIINHYVRKLQLTINKLLSKSVMISRIYGFTKINARRERVILILMNR